MNEKQKEIVIQEVCDRLCIEKGEEHPSYNDGIFFTTRFAENLLAAQTVEFPEPSEEDRESYRELKISSEFLSEVRFRMSEFKNFRVIQNVLLGYQKLMNEGKV